MMEKDRLLASGRILVINYLGNYPSATFKDIREANMEILPRYLDEILAELQTDRVIVARHDNTWGTGTKYSLRENS